MSINPDHDDIVDQLYERLHDTHRYERIFTEVEYHHGGINGEVDVLSIHGDCRHYYEVKCKDSVENYNKAVLQFTRYHKAFPDEKTRFIYVTPERIREVHL